MKVNCFIKTTLLFLFVCNSHLIAGNFSFTNYSTSQGLSHKTVNCMLRDQDGFLWIGTTHGLNRFDGYGFKNIHITDTDGTSSGANIINAIAENKDGTIFIATKNGLKYFDKITEKIHSIVFKKNKYCEFQTVTTDENGNIWTCNPMHGLFKLTKTNGIYICKFVDIASILGIKKGFTISKIIYYEQNLWICTNFGVITFDIRNSRALILPLGFKDLYILSVKIGLSHELLITSAVNGIYQLNTQSLKGKWISFANLKSQNKEISWLTDAIRLQNKDLCIATTSGLFSLHNDSISLISSSNSTTSELLKIDGSTGIYLDKENILWAGTLNFGIFALKNHKNNFQQINIFDSKNYSHSLIQSMNVFNDKSILYGGPRGLFYFKNKSNGVVINKITNKFISSIQTLDGKNCLVITLDSIFTFDSRDLKLKNAIKYHMTFCARKAKNDVLWSAYWSQGINGYNLKTKQEYKITIDSLDLSRNSAYCITNDNDDGSIWLGTFGSGLVHIQNPTSNKPIITKYTHKRGVNSISQNEILTIHDDSRGNLWISTYGSGMDCFNKTTQKFETYTTRNGLHSNMVEAINSDKNGNIWIATNILSKYDITNHTFTNFPASEGVLDEFNVGVTCKTSDGQIFFGGNGIVFFDPENILTISNPSQPILTSLKMFGLPIKPGDTIYNQVPYTKAISYSDSLTIPYSLHNFSIEFASLQFLISSNIIYSYMLEGIDKDWIPAGYNNHIASYSGLEPGTYIFKVKATNGKGEWSKPRILIIEIVPPWWKTWWFRISLSITFVLLILWYIAYRIKKVNVENTKLEQIIKVRTFELNKANEFLQEQSDALHNQNDNLKENQLVIEMKNNQLGEALEMKDKLIGIIGHDFKNSLTGLQGNATLLNQDSTGLSPDKIKKYSSNILSSANSIINQMFVVLDWAQDQMNQLRYSPVEINIEVLLDDAISLIKESAIQKQITVTTQYDYSSNALIDPRMISTVFRNVLTNAIKFTPRNGKIHIIVQENITVIDITIIDTGIGMSEDKVASLFINPINKQSTLGTENEKGLGLGLVISKSFIEKNNGSITVTSKEGEGSIFTLTLPKGENEATRKIELQDFEQKINDLDTNQIEHYTVLIIDDNKEVLDVLHDVFSNNFTVILAKDGEEGLYLGQNMLPDIIISDINLPKMSGIEICKLFKSDPLTNHIPILLITAQKDTETQQEAYLCGANDFIEKPFNTYNLKQKVVAILETRKLFGEQIRKSIDEKRVFEMPEDFENKLMKQIVQLILDNMSNANFDVNTVAESVRISRTQLYRIFKNTTGKSLSDFIKDMRMSKAKEMLKTGKYRIAEVAYEVGFTDPKYFTKCFTKEFGISPSGYAEKGN